MCVFIGRENSLFDEMRVKWGVRENIYVTQNLINEN